MNELTTTLKVTGMSCGSCVRHVETALRGVQNVKSVTVDLAGGEALVRHASPIDPSALVGAVCDAGYDASLSQ